MKKIVIIGGGFGGLACARVLRQCTGTDVTVLDRKITSDFLPLLPDILGRRMAPSAVRMPLPVLAGRYGFRFVHDAVTSVDLSGRRIVGQSGRYAYDYLVLAAGTCTNFYGDGVAASQAYPLDDVADAERICMAADGGGFKSIVIVGGGYTGVEIASHLRRRLQHRVPAVDILLVESSECILGSLPDWMRDYVEVNLARVGVDVLVNCRARMVAPDRVQLSNGRVCERARVIWAAGVQTPAFVREMGRPMTQQGRLEVDEYLGMGDGVFGIGDVAAVKVDGVPIRMAVQFSLAQGRLTGHNIIRALTGRPLRAYRPLDLGYVVPMADLHSCGLAMGRKVKGAVASFLHYMMCVHCCVSPAQKLRVLRSLVQRV